MRTATSNTAFALRGILNKNAFHPALPRRCYIEVAVSLITSVNFLNNIRKQARASIVATPIFVTCDPLPCSAAHYVSHGVSFHSKVSRNGHSFKPFCCATTSF